MPSKSNQFLVLCIFNVIVQCPWSGFRDSVTLILSSDDDDDDDEYIFNFWHSGTLALRAERQSAGMSEINNVG